MRYFKVSNDVDVVDIQIKLFGIFWPLFKKFGQNLNEFAGHAVF